MIAASPRSGAAAERASLPLARRAAAEGGTSTAPVQVRWNHPAVPEEFARLFSPSVEVVADPTAIDPRELPAFAALSAHARSEQIIRALAQRTNLVLPASAVTVVGDGTLASTISTALAAAGSRVTRALSSPVAALQAHLAGVRTTTTLPLDADLVITTGEGHDPLAVDAVPGVRIDAAVTLHRPTPPGGTLVRPFVHRVAARSWVVEAPDVYEAAGGRVADLLLALSILRSAPAGPRSADRRLAELAIS